VQVAEVREIVALAQIDPSLYSFESEQHESLCLVAFGQTWKVFISERGARVEEQDFDSQDAACVYSLKRLFQLAQH